MNYEIGNDLMSQGYIVRCDTNGHLQFGTIENILARFAEARHWPRICRKLFANETYSAMNGTSYDLIGWIWRDGLANQKAWDEFYSKSEAGRSTLWITSDSAWNKMDCSRDHVLK